MLFVGRAQEKTPLFRTEKRRNPVTGATYPWIVRSTGVVNHFYFYAVDADFGPFFLKSAPTSPTTPSCASTAMSGPSGRPPRPVSASLRWTMAAPRARPVPVAEDLRPAGPGQDRCAAAQVTGPAAAPVHRDGPDRRLPLRHLDAAGRVQPHSNARCAAVGPGAVRGGDPGEPRHRPAGQGRAGLRPADPDPRAST